MCAEPGYSGLLMTFAGIIATRREDDSGVTKVLTPDCDEAIFSIKFRSLFDRQTETLNSAKI